MSTPNWKLVLLYAFLRLEQKRNPKENFLCFWGHLKIPKAPSGTIWPLKLEFFCKFYFTNFPFDSHECHLEYGDDLYSTSWINLNTASISYRWLFLRTPNLNNFSLQHTFTIIHKYVHILCGQNGIWMSSLA